MTKHVLVVDDSQVSRLMVKAIIESKYPNWHVEEASDSLDALTKCQDRAYDYIGLDMNMPGRDGLTIAPELQKHCPNAKIALITANMQERVKEQASKQGLIFVSKPITESKILALFEQLEQQ